MGEKKQIFLQFFFLENRLKAGTTFHTFEINFSVNFIVQMLQTL